MLTKLNTAADAWLLAHGVRVELFRRALRFLALLALLSLIAGAALLPLTVQVLCFGVGVALAGLNLFSLSRTVGRVLSRPTEGGLRAQASLFVFFRIAVTLAVLLLILRQTPYAAFGLLAGFAASMLVLLVIFRPNV